MHKCFELMEKQQKVSTGTSLREAHPLKNLKSGTWQGKEVTSQGSSLAQVLIKLLAHISTSGRVLGREMYFPLEYSGCTAMALGSLLLLLVVRQ